MNGSPSLSATTPADRALKTALIGDVLGIVLTPEFLESALCLVHWHHSGVRRCARLARGGSDHPSHCTAGVPSAFTPSTNANSALASRLQHTCTLASTGPNGDGDKAPITPAIVEKPDDGCAPMDFVNNPAYRPPLGLFQPLSVLNRFRNIIACLVHLVSTRQQVIADLLRRLLFKLAQLVQSCRFYLFASRLRGCAYHRLHQLPFSRHLQLQITLHWRGERVFGVESRLTRGCGNRRVDHHNNMPWIPDSPEMRWSQQYKSPALGVSEGGRLVTVLPDTTDTCPRLYFFFPYTYFF